MATGLENLKIHQMAKDTVICEAEETRSNLNSCSKKGFGPENHLQKLIAHYTEFMKATHGYIKFLKTSQLKQSVTS